MSVRCILICTQDIHWNKIEYHICNAYGPGNAINSIYSIRVSLKKKYLHTSVCTSVYVIYISEIIYLDRFLYLCEDIVM